MQLYAVAFEAWSKSGMKFRKFHVTIHYQAFVERYGVPSLSYAGWWEKAMRFLVKVPYQRTGRRIKGMYTHLMHRIAFVEVIAKKKSALERHNPGETLSWQLETLESGKKVWRLCRTQATTGDNIEGAAVPRASSWDNTGYLTYDEM